VDTAILEMVWSLYRAYGRGRPWSSCSLQKKLPILGLWEEDLYTTIHWRRVNNLVLIIFTTTNEIYGEPVLPF
jgi:hypothetical protein